MSFASTLPLAAIALALPALAAAEDFAPLRIAPDAACPRTVGLSTPGVVLGCWCGGSDTGGSIWGTGIYTSDSPICTAARHAGAVDADGGAVIVQVLAGQDSYQGSTANGVTTSDYGSYSTSFAFVALPWGAEAAAEASGSCPPDATQLAGSMTCSCTADMVGGSVWGSGIYTNDSSICTAARHFGAIGADGGTVTVIEQPGRESYDGSTANGISSMSYGAWGASFSFGK